MDASKLMLQRVIYFDAVLLSLLLQRLGSHTEHDLHVSSYLNGFKQRLGSHTDTLVLRKSSLSVQHYCLNFGFQPFLVLLLIFVIEDNKPRWRHSEHCLPDFVKRSQLKRTWYQNTLFYKKVSPHTTQIIIHLEKIKQTKHKHISIVVGAMLDSADATVPPTRLSIAH